jgi:sugar phosphate isomerase/epimerase
MRLGIGSYTYGWASGAYGWGAMGLSLDRPFMTAQELIDRAYTLQVPVVQICVRPSLHEMNGGQLEEIRAHADEKGIEIEVGTKGSDPEHLLKYLDIAQAVGSNLVRTIFTDVSSGLKTETEQIASIGQKYADNQVYLAIENHEALQFHDLVTLIENINNPYIGICLDTVNSLGRGEGIQEVTDALMKHTKTLHIKDFTVIRGETDMGFTITGAPTGQGRLEIRSQLLLLKSTNPQESVVIEQWTPFTVDIDRTIELQERWAEEGVDYLKGLMAELEKPAGSTINNE